MTHKFNKVTFPKWTLESLCKSLSISIQSEVKLLLHCITTVGIIKLINLQLVCVIELRVGGKQQNFSSWISRPHKLCFLLKGTDCCRKLQSALNCHFHWFSFVLPISLFSSESSRPGAKTWFNDKWGYPGTLQTFLLHFKPKISKISAAVTFCVGNSKVVVLQFNQL